MKAKATNRLPCRLPGAWYTLRRTIPPWDAARGIPELGAFCTRHRVDEVMIKVDTEEFSHGLPTVDWLRAYRPVLQRIKAEVNRRGVVFSINPWVSLGHADRGRRTRAAHPDVDLMVGHDGTACVDCACPLSPGWRALTHELWGLYASTGPAVIWVEDDIRLFNHLPVRFGCFCPRHVAEFGRRIGRRVTREQVVAAVLAPGRPHPWRRAWMAFSGAVMVDVAGRLERAVHAASPSTRLGLMSSDPAAHSVEGRDWPAFAAALAGPRPLVARPAMYSYNGDSPTMLYESAQFVQGTLQCLGRPRGLTVQTEVDNGMFSLYAKSAELTRLQIALSFALGADGVTLNLFDHLGTPLARTPEFGDLLRRNKPFFGGLAERCRGGRMAGVRYLHAPDAAAHVRLSAGAAYGDLASDSQVWRRALEPFGFASTLEPGPVAAVTGQVVRALPARDLRDLLSHGVLLDLGAAAALAERGFGRHLGVRVRRVFNRVDETLAAEEHVHPDFGGAPGKYLSLAFFNGQGAFPLAELAPAQGAVVVSRVVDPDRRARFPLLTLFENDWGGRVAVYPIEMRTFPGNPFLNPARRDQLDAVVRWLARGRVPLVVEGGVFPLAFRQNFRDRAVAGLLNLSLDAWPCAVLDLDAGRRRVRKVEWLDARGAWRPAPFVSATTAAGRVRLAVRRRLPALSVAALTVWWA